MQPIYVDNHATTPVDLRVVDAMLPYFTQVFGNAASVNHVHGTDAADAVQSARESIAHLVGTDSRSLIFTSGATEANNLAIKGVMHAATDKRHLIVNQAEHRAVLDPARRLRRDGFDVDVLPVDEHGMVKPDDVAAAIRDDTALVSVMYANNEVGTINSVEEIGQACRERGVLFHCDAVQALGSIRIRLHELPVDLLSLSAHKVYGPKGIGVLYVRQREGRIPITPLIDGGGHERGLRSGTLPVPLIVGFGEACRILDEQLESDVDRIRNLRDELHARLVNAVSNLVMNGHPERRLPGNLNISVPGVDGDALMNGLTKIAVSSGSACTSADPAPSHVLSAMGRDDQLTRASIRFGVGRFNDATDVDTIVSHFTEVVKRLQR